MNLVPVLPESAPFTAEQRAYLNGFLAGLFSCAPSNVASSATAPPTLEPLTILWGSQTGTCEALAKRLAKEAGRQGFAPTIHDLAQFSVAQLATERNVLIVTSTYGDGEPPDNARAFWDLLVAPTAPPLTKLRFSLCALGDSNYPKFCGFGRELDLRLEQLGATRLHPRIDCDVEYDEAFLRWMNGAVAVAKAPADGSASSATNGTAPALVPEMSATPSRPSEEKSVVPYSKKNPFPARLLTNRRLNAPGSAKDVRHFEISFAASGLIYEVGDALGVRPQNDPTLVSELLTALRCTGDEPVPSPQGLPWPLREALIGGHEIARIPQALLAAFAERTEDATLRQVVSPSANGELTRFLWGRDILDLFLAHPAVGFSAKEFVGMLRPLQPRLYSISSSPKAHPGEVHLTVSAVRYESLGRQRGGVCSTFLADRVASETAVPVFVHANKAFRPPPNDRPLIMVGPGTGVAPFRAFLEERRATGASGRNWLFFGDQKSATDFLYRDELEAFQRDGLLHRLNLAWSRDQAAKVYVQDHLRQHAAEVWSWLQDGAGFYVCGDASRMARDVEAALLEVARTAGNLSEEQATEYVKQLKAEKRYLRDVY
ncbi:MAG TPA: sulfite reductase subunit alpha [Verrucomicrobiota bacterium]|nr:sulfite reductase subunit alpha [Verrucomicrobiales bacterium]HRI15177.1 sulfite reductase subunit alpha [Verrucomicrobiota bacterium]